MDRRRALIQLAGLALGACRRPVPPTPAEKADARPAPATDSPWREITFEPSADTPDGEEALAFAPRGAEAWPLVIALHGRGEAGRGLEVGARGWRDDYAVERMHERLYAPPLTVADLHGFASETRLAAQNASLAAHPFQGLRLATPYTPDLPDRSPAGAAPFARFVVEQLIPAVEGSPLEASGDAGADRRRGIDGVSMGGRLALLVGFARPDAFSTIGALQPAIRVDEAPLFSRLAKEAKARASFALRLLSSDDDPFLAAVQALSQHLTSDGVEHDLVVVPGPHDYEFNRGPGSAELLLFHERRLRGWGSF